MRALRKSPSRADVSLGEQRLQEVIAAIASAQPAPGAGAAGAIALALAAACAGKAASIGLKHHADDVELRRASSRFLEISQRALDGADADAEGFERFMHAKKETLAQQLIVTDRRLVELAEELVAAIRAVEARIDATLAGDLAAARLLAQASQLIQARNINETQAEATRS